jgi:hypothetical protein
LVTHNQSPIGLYAYSNGFKKVLVSASDWLSTSPSSAVSAIPREQLDA